MERIGDPTLRLGADIAYPQYMTTIILTSLLVAAGAIVTLDAAIRIASTLLRRTLARKAEARRKLSRLAANVQLRYFSAVLGEPAIRQQWSDGIVENVYVDDLYYVQALSDIDGQVVAYCVTLRSEKFRLKVPFPNAGRYSSSSTQVKALLNASKFAAVCEPTQIYKSVTARRFWYSETYYFGNPSNYQTVALGVNDSSPADLDLDSLVRFSSPRAEPTTASLTSSELEVFRKVSAPNTYAIGAPHVVLAEHFPSGCFGADLDAVRVFS